MVEIELTGLRADSPIGAMAAFGLLRVVAGSERSRELKPALRWERVTGNFRAVLRTEADFGRNALVDLLRRAVSDELKNEALTWTEQLKDETPSDFHLRATSEIARSSAVDREAADWIAAFGSDIEGKEGELEKTVFDMSVARQRFPFDALRLAEFLATDARGRNDKTLVGDFEEALFGPWTYTDDQHSFGWDPATMKIGAFTEKAPTKMRNVGVRAAVWLAFESLPLFPCFYDHGLAVRGFERKARRQYFFYWPIWSRAISLSTIRSLLCWPGLFKAEDAGDEISGRGIQAVYRAERFKPNKYLASFRQPEIVYSATEGCES